MATVTMQFNTEDFDQRVEMRRALSALDMALALNETVQRVFRPARKHGYPSPKIQQMIEKINKLIPEGDEYEEISCEWLIGLLEDEFHAILEEYNVNMDELLY